jgi:hypothetical protein
MKYKTTAKAVKEGYYTIIEAGYCDLQSLLNYKIPSAYSSKEWEIVPLSFWQKITRGMK